VVVEVKTGRAGARFTPGMRLGRAPLARLRRAAAELARGAPARVDLVEVRLDRQRRVRLVHHPNVSSPLEAPRAPGARGNSFQGTRPHAEPRVRGPQDEVQSP
jgi:hypothetical protein